MEMNPVRRRQEWNLIRVDILRRIDDIKGQLVSEKNTQRREILQRCLAYDEKMSRLAKDFYEMYRVKATRPSQALS